MTRWLLVLGLWGMLAGTAGAEPAPAFFEALWIANDLQKENKKLDACYQQMQAAMEAMEEFIPYSWVDLDLPMNGGVRQEFSHKDVLRFRGAEAKWADAKQCWKRQ